MPIMIELVDSRKRVVALDPSEQPAQLKYLVAGVFDNPITGMSADDQVDSIVQATIPAYFDSQRFRNYEVDPSQGNGLYNVTVNYGGRKPPGLMLLNFELGGEKFKVTQGLIDSETGNGLWRYYPASDGKGGVQSKIDYKGAIGIKTKSGTTKAEGLELNVKTFAFTVSRTFGADFPLTGDYVNLLYDSEWCTNVGPLTIEFANGLSLDFDGGELLFQGATATQKSGGTDFNDPDGDLSWEGEVVMKFAANRNLKDETIAGVADVTKLGWEHLEAIYEENDSGNVLIPVVRQVNVTQVYNAVDLSGLFV